MNELKKEYIGDGVYVEMRGDSIKLITNNGIADTNIIYLGIDEVKTLELYFAKFKDLFV